jgi:hypothetical protein
MNSRFVDIAAIALALTLGIMATSSAEAAQADDEARALKVAEAKLAALAREGVSPVPPDYAPTKVAEQKPAKPVSKKRSTKARVKAKSTHPEVASKAPRVTNRRLSLGEVQGILATSRDFTGSDLSGLSLVGMDFSGVKFNRANLQRANLERADLAETDLELADLTGANLRGASLNQARLRGTRLEGTRFDGALWIDKTVCKKGSTGLCIE